MPTHTRSLLSPTIDFFCVGGASILFLIFTFVFFDRTTSINTIAWIAYYLAFAVNYPHFLVSYQLLYKDFGHQIFRQVRFFWAAVLMPLSLIGVLAYGIFSHQTGILSSIVHLMFLTVGWHYVKQVYGCVIVYSVLNKVFLSTVEKWCIRISMYSIWFLSWLNMNISTHTIDFYGIPCTTLGLPYWSFETTKIFTYSSLSSVVLFMLMRKWNGKALPPLTAIAAFGSIYAWYLPTFYHPIYFYMVPFFHSLQYLPFVAAFRKNKVQKFWLYFLIAIILGALSFWAIPTGLDRMVSYNHQLFGVTLFICVFNLFINIHHYFIDNVLWRGDNHEMRTYLFALKASEHIERIDYLKNFLRITNLN